MQAKAFEIIACEHLVRCVSYATCWSLKSFIQSLCWHRVCRSMQSISTGTKNWFPMRWMQLWIWVRWWNFMNFFVLTHQQTIKATVNGEENKWNSMSTEYDVKANCFIDYAPTFSLSIVFEWCSFCHVYKCKENARTKRICHLINTDWIYY